ncbi:MAG: hypothetical protein ACRCZZ_05840 [Phocaeicola sp.]
MTKASKRPIAMGVGAIRMGDTGDGVPGENLTALPQPTKSSVAFNFSDPKTIQVDIEGPEEPLYVELVKDAADYIEFSIPTPDSETIARCCGGEVVDEEGVDRWEKPTHIPDIVQTFQCETKPKQGKKVVYTVVNGKVVGKLSQAPGAEQAELLLVRVYIQSAETADGVVKTAFTREVVTI